VTHIDLSHCHKITDMGIAVLGAAKATKLKSLNISSCNNISDTSLDSLKRCSSLAQLDVRDCPQVSINGCHKFVSSLYQSKNSFIMREEKLLESQSFI
jgi:hypothetical protein